MPPELSPSPYHIVTPPPLLRRPILPKLHLGLSPTHKSFQRMNLLITTRKTLPALVFILIFASLIRFLKITIITSPSASPPQAFLTINRQGPSTHTSQTKSSSKPSLLKQKELRFLSDIISHRAPCNLLVFGLEEQYLALSFINAGGTTIFLEDNPDKVSAFKTNSTNTTRAYRVEYKNSAKEAYELLQHARGNLSCSPWSGKLVSTCKLALTELPKEIYEVMWDVIVVDGPSGDGAEAPGRMASIYTASMLARRNGNMSNVVVHDVHRTIEKWFSWEFLCDYNLVSSKANFWNFRIPLDQSNSTLFCPLIN